MANKFHWKNRKGEVLAEADGRVLIALIAVIGFGFFGIQTGVPDRVLKLIERALAPATAGPNWGSNRMFVSAGGVDRARSEADVAEVARLNRLAYVECRSTVRWILDFARDGREHYRSLFARGSSSRFVHRAHVTPFFFVS